MRLDQQIRVNDLLLRREELFLRIHAVEAETARIFGEPYPFTRPELPSDRRGKRKNSHSARATSSQPIGPGSPPTSSATAPSAGAGNSGTLRKLAENESAYRVTYRQFGQTRIEIHREAAALATLLAAQTPNLTLLRLETLDSEGAVVSRLFDGGEIPLNPTLGPV